MSIPFYGRASSTSQLDKSFFTFVWCAEKELLRSGWSFEQATAVKRNSGITSSAAVVVCILSALWMSFRSCVISTRSSLWYVQWAQLQRPTFYVELPSSEMSLQPSEMKGKLFRVRNAAYFIREIWLPSEKPFHVSDCWQRRTFRRGQRSISCVWGTPLP